MFMATIHVFCWKRATTSRLFAGLC
uniref:Uncharacterized protein n=1 Tax=Arundo donax TaxID=35708 RepID=A0A0A8ZUG9_ARUDO